MKDASLVLQIPAPALAAGATGILPLVGRFFLGGIFFMSGLNKVADPAGTIGYIASAGLPLPQVVLALAIVIEVVGSVLLVLGFRARLVAAALASFTLAAAFSFHFDFSDQNQLIHFMKNFAVAGGLLQVVEFGAGRYSINRQV